MKTKHGYAFGTRGTFALEQNWLAEWNIRQFEGGKAFPTAEIAGIDKYPDTVSAPRPPDNYICSGGWTSESGSNWDIVNYTGTELQIAKGKTWPKTTVKAGQDLEIKWLYTAPHATRGYNYWITKDSWNPGQRITIDQLEPVPFCKQHYATALPYGAAPLKTLVTLPQKKGYHVMIVAWLVADTGMAFYQTFDLDFDESAVPGPKVSIIPFEKELEKGEPAHFVTSVEGEEPFTYSWNLPPELGTYDNRLDKDTIIYTTDNVKGNKAFDIICRVTDKNGKSSEAHASLKVKDTTGPVKPTLEIMPTPQTVKAGIDAKFNAIVKDGEGPFTYSWNLPAPLTSSDINHHMSHITYVTSNVTQSTTFDITCKVTDRNGQSADANAVLTVQQDVPGHCTDPNADNYPAWNPASTYPGEKTHTVNYGGVVWINKHYIDPGALPPDINDSWKLLSRIATRWNNVRSYEADSYVNHNGFQWKASYHANPGNEPGSSGGAMWMKTGSEACDPNMSGG